MSRLFKKVSRPRTTPLMPGVVYEPLPDDESIRYMALEAGKAGDPLSCTLHISRLRKTPYFEAISYVWGSENRDHEVLCNGKLVKVTANLSEVLMSLRLPNEPRNIWADSICINQEDKKEKGQQVALMGQLYMRASRVIICIGKNHDGHAEKVESLISELDDRVLRGIKTAGLSCDTFPFPGPEEKQRLLADDRWGSLMILMRHPWFGRGWVVQEAGLSQNAVIQWGDMEISWLKFIRSWVWVHRRLTELILLHNDASRLNQLHVLMYRARHKRDTMSLYPFYDKTTIDLLNILDFARRLGLKEPNDRVYAFLSFANEAKLGIKLQPDYGTPVLDVYADFARQHLRAARDTRLLHQVQQTEATLKASVPSWVPRWDIMLYDNSIYHTGLDAIKSPSLGSSTRTRPIILDDNILKVRGVIFDRLSFTSDVLSRTILINDVRSLWAHVSGRWPESPYPPSYRTEAFTTALMLFREFGGFMRWKECKEAYIHLLNGNADISTEERELADFFHECLQRHAHNRRFIVTKSGYYGHGPHSARDNDICCVIFGTQSPFILRDTEREGRYKVIGDVLIPGKTVGIHMSNPTDAQIMVPLRLGEKGCRDWEEYGLEEEDVYLC